jgi:hypothetical protein
MPVMDIFDNEFERLESYPTLLSLLKTQIYKR